MSSSVQSPVPVRDLTPAQLGDVDPGATLDDYVDLTTGRVVDPPGAVTNPEPEPEPELF
jgi:hypothetical protein